MLEVNQKINIILNSLDDLISGTIYSQDKNCFNVCFASPVENLKPNKVYKCSVNTNKSLLKFKTKAVKISDDKYSFLIPSNYTEIQRREHTRVNSALPVKIINNGFEVNAETVNISGGGMKLKTQKAFNKGDVVNIIINFSTTKSIKLKYEILRVEKSGDRNLNYIASGVFQNINNIDRISIVQFCFKQQLELRCFSNIADRRY